MRVTGSPVAAPAAVLARKVELTLAGPAAGVRVELPFEPRAVLCWWAPAPADGPAPNRGGIGFAAADGTRVAVAWASEPGRERVAAAGRLEDAALAVLADADTSEPSLLGRPALDPGGLSLDCSGTAGAGVTVHCFALGGPLDATAGVLAVPETPGRRSVDGLHFRPALVLLVPSLCARIGDREPGLLAAFGAACAHGQGASGFAARHGAEPGSVAGCQRVGAAVVVPRPGDPPDVAAEATVTSLDEAGFTLDWTRVGGARSVAYLALSGGAYEVGATTKPLRRRSRRARLASVEPAGLITATWGLRAGADSRRIGRLCLGAASSPHEAGCATWGEKLEPGAPTHTCAWTSSARLVQVPDTSAGATVVHAEAELAALGRRGFRLRWPVAEGLKRQVLYVAVGAERRPAGRGLLGRP